MARTPIPAVAPEEDANAPETPTEEPGKLTDQMSDEEIMAAINAEMAQNAARNPGPKTVTIKELFEQGVALVAAATGKTFRNGVPQVSENTAVKLYELTLGWALQNRGGASHSILPEEGGEVEEVAPEGLPIPNEIIGGDPAPEE